MRPALVAAAAAIALALVPAGATSSEAGDPLRVLWAGDVEDGSLSDCDSDGGGGEFNSGSGNSRASRAQAHTGSWSAAARLATGKGGTRLFRWKESRSNRDAFYEAWLYFPTAYRLTGDPCCGRFLNVFQFKSRSESGANDPLWVLDLQNRDDGSLYPTLIWWHRTLPGPHEGEVGFRRYEPPADVRLPIRRWFRVRARLRQSRDFDGVVRFWLDGRLIFDQTAVRTSFSNCDYNSWCAANEWSVNNYSDGLSPSPAVIYVDDAVVSK